MPQTAEERGRLQEWSPRGRRLQWKEFDENTAAAMCYTSGSTGIQGVLYSHRSNVLPLDGQQHRRARHPRPRHHAAGGAAVHGQQLGISRSRRGMGTKR